MSASSITKNAVESASACAAVGASAQVRELRGAGKPVRGSIRCEPFTAVPDPLRDIPLSAMVWWLRPSPRPAGQPDSVPDDAPNASRLLPPALSDAAPIS